MATYATLTVPVADIIGANFNESRASVWIEPNTPVVLADSIRVGGRREQVVNGVATFANLVTTNSATNPTSFGYRVTISAPPKGAAKREDIVTLTTSDFPFTATGSLKDIPEAWDNIIIPAEWRSEFMDQAQALLDAQVAIAGPVDATVEGLLKNTGGIGPLSSGALARGAGVVSARANGVVANGSTNDTAALQAVINATAALGGGSVLLPRGTIIVNAEITVPEHIWLTSEAPGGWENYGQVNAGTTIRLANSSGLSSSQGVVRFVYTGSLTTERRHQGGMVGITIDGNRTTNTANSGVVMAGVRFIHLERVSAVRCGLHGFTSVTDGTATSEMSFVATFAGFNGGKGYELFGGDSTITGAVAGNNDLDGFYLGLAATVVTGVSSWNNKRDGLTIASTAATQHLSIVGGQFYDNDRAGITVESPGANSMLGNSIVGASCHGNGRQDFITYPTATDRVGIRVVGVHTPSMLAIHGVSTGNRTYTLPSKFQQYGIALITAGCNPIATGISGTENNTALWYRADATTFPESSAGRFLPIVDNLVTIGRSALRWANVVALRHEVYAAANDAQPRVRMGSTGGAAAIDFGAGGSTATDVGFTRGAAGVLELTDGTTGGGAGAMRLGNNAAKGARLWSGSGAPTTPGAAGISYALGDAYLRTDTPTTANQRLYLVTTAGTSPTWTGIL